MIGLPASGLPAKQLSPAGRCLFILAHHAFGPDALCSQPSSRAHGSYAQSARQTMRRQYRACQILRKGQGSLYESFDVSCN